MFFSRKPNLEKLDPAIANQALLLAMEWGANLLKPVNERLSKLYPTLTPAELDRYNALAQDAMKAGHELVYKEVERLGQSSPELPARCQALFKKQYPWASDAATSRIYSQGMYYAWHDGAGA